VCPEKTNLCKRSLSWNQEQTSHPSIVVDRDWRGLESLLLVMRAKREWHKDFIIKCCTTDKRSEICWLLLFLTQNNDSFPFHVLTFNSHILSLLLILLFILLYLALLCFAQHNNSSSSLVLKLLYFGGEYRAVTPACSFL